MSATFNAPRATHLKLKPVTPNRPVRLDDAAARVDGKIKTGEALERAGKKQVERISDLQRLLYADARYADDYTNAYRGVLEHTSTKWARWYVVPADDKDVRNWMVAGTIADTLEDLDLSFPPADPSVLKMKIE